MPLSRGCSPLNRPRSPAAGLSSTRPWPRRREPSPRPATAAGSSACPPCAARQACCASSVARQVVYLFEEQVLPFAGLVFDRTDFGHELGGFEHFLRH